MGISPRSRPRLVTLWLPLLVHLALSAPGAPALADDATGEAARKRAATWIPHPENAELLVNFPSGIFEEIQPESPFQSIMFNPKTHKAFHVMLRIGADDGPKREDASWIVLQKSPHNYVYVEKLTMTLDDRVIQRHTEFTWDSAAYWEPSEPYRRRKESRPTAEGILSQDRAPSQSLPDQAVTPILDPKSLPMEMNFKKKQDLVPKPKLSDQELPLSPINQLQ